MCFRINFNTHEYYKRSNNYRIASKKGIKFPLLNSKLTDIKGAREQKADLRYKQIHWHCFEFHQKIIQTKMRESIQTGVTIFKKNKKKIVEIYSLGIIRDFVDTAIMLITDIVKIIIAMIPNSGTTCVVAISPNTS